MKKTIPELLANIDSGKSTAGVKMANAIKFIKDNPGILSCVPKNTRIEYADIADVAERRFVNDAFRHSIKGGRIFLSQDVLDLGRDKIFEIAWAVIHYINFPADEDPSSTHDNGCVEIEGVKFRWRITYVCSFPDKDENLIVGEDGTSFYLNDINTEGRITKFALIIDMDRVA